LDREPAHGNPLARSWRQTRREEQQQLSIKHENISFLDSSEDGARDGVEIVHSKICCGRKPKRETDGTKYSSNLNMQLTKHVTGQNKTK
jgi:hypothetical protein